VLATAFAMCGRAMIPAASKPRDPRIADRRLMFSTAVLLPYLVHRSLVRRFFLLACARMTFT
jgi:hypothetical protein